MGGTAASLTYVQWNRGRAAELLESKLEWPYLYAMQRQALRVLIALTVFVAAALPVSARAMPMPAGMSGAAVQQHCQNCPQHPMTRAHSGKMPACQVLACASAVATLSAPALMPGRALLRAAYMMAPPARWTAAQPAPDPFPPRPVALI